MSKTSKQSDAKAEIIIKDELIEKLQAEIAEKKEHFESIEGLLVHMCKVVGVEPDPNFVNLQNRINQIQEKARRFEIDGQQVRSWYGI
jgi:hypothetical protein